jgi:hypothetical protein
MYSQKSDSFEAFLSSLNDTVHEGMGDFSPPLEPFITGQIVGLPRSGTTIVYQLLALTGRVGYPSNVMALFWQAPTIGAKLQKHLAAPGPTISTRSVAGRTAEPLDPHEFGYFWRRALGHSSNSVKSDQKPLDWSTLQSILDAVTGIFDSPVVYKNFLAMVHADSIRCNLERQKFLVIQRPMVDTAASLLAVRRRIGIPENDEFGLVAENLSKDAPLLERVANQVCELKSLIESCNFENDPSSMQVDYISLCNDPRSTIGAILEFVGGDTTPGWDSNLPRRLPLGGGSANVTAAERKRLERLITQGQP